MIFDKHGQIIMCIEEHTDGYGVRSKHLEYFIDRKFPGVSLEDVQDIIRINQLGWFSTIEGESWLVKNRSQRHLVCSLERIYKILIFAQDYNLDHVRSLTSRFPLGQVELVSLEMGFYAQGGEWRGLEPIGDIFVGYVGLPRPDRVLRSAHLIAVDILESAFARSLSEYMLVIEAEGVSPEASTIVSRALDIRQEPNCLSWRRVDLELGEGELTGKRYTNG